MCFLVRRFLRDTVAQMIFLIFEEKSMYHREMVRIAFF